MPQKPDPRRFRFVEAYLKSRNATQAAREAGYSPARASATGSSLLKHPDVVAALRAKGLEPPRGVHPRTQLRKPLPARLSERERRFALAYLACGNASEAARRIGVGSKAARGAGFRFLHRPRVAAFIEKEAAVLGACARIDAERVMQELARIAFADMRAFADWSAADVSIKPSAATSPDAGAAIAELRTKPSRKGLKTTIRLHSKPQALDRLARILGLHAKRPAQRAAAPSAADARKYSHEDLLRIMRGENKK